MLLTMAAIAAWRSSSVRRRRGIFLIPLPWTADATADTRIVRAQGRFGRRLQLLGSQQANKKSDITWDEATFSEYIKDPKAKVPSTKMAFAGIKDEQKI
jgi:hypothetical protein